MSRQNQALCDIRNFTEFLEKSLRRKVLEYTLKPLTKPGENYGSVMQSVEVEVAGINSPNERDVMHLVTKTAITNPLLVEIFQPKISFVKEAHFYSDIIPAIEQLEQTKYVPEEERIDAFIRCFGSRISLDPNVTVADVDAIVLLENIKHLDFVNVDRRIGFDINETRAVIKQLAKFHSLCIATRRLEPNVFNSRIRPFLKPIKIMCSSDSERLFKNVCKDLDFINGFDSKVCDDIKQQLKISYEFLKNDRIVSDTPFTTVVHRDLWTNNVMFKRSDTFNAPIKVKFYDFQLYFYESFAFDLVLMVFTSLQSEALAINFKAIIGYYHEEFIKSLKFVGCPLDEYTFEKMWHEIREKAKIELLHVLLVMKICFINEKAVTDINKVKPGNVLGDAPSTAFLKRIELILNIFYEHGLL